VYHSLSEEATLAWGLMPLNPLLAIHPHAQHGAFWLFHVKQRLKHTGYSLSSRSSPFLSSLCSRKSPVNRLNMAPASGPLFQPFFRINDLTFGELLYIVFCSDYLFGVILIIRLMV
jgi:hypothetical protein